MLHKLLAKDRHFFPDSVWKYLALTQWFPTGEEFLPGEEFHEFWGGISTL